MEIASKEFKNSSYTTDEFVEHLGLKVTVIIPSARPITGKMISLSKKYLTLEHRDGSISKIRRDDVSIISQVRPEV